MTINGGFETGDFTDWITIGDASIETAEFGSGPTEGEFQALITTGQGSISDAELEEFLELDTGDLDNLGNGNATEGSALQLEEITVEAGDIVTFDWNFLTNEGTPSSFNDFAFVSIASDPSELADTGSSFIPSKTAVFASETGFGTFTYEFDTAGTFTIGVGVVDVGDTVVDSGLLIDNLQIITSEDEPNDVIPDANDTGLSSDESGTFTVTGEVGNNPDIDPGLDVDLFEVQLDEGDGITLDIDASEFGSPLDPILRVFDSDGNQVAVNDDFNGLDSFIQFVATTSDTYYVGVSGFSNFNYDPFEEESGTFGSTGEYTLEVTVTEGITGTSDNDILVGTEGFDIISGFEGDDSVLALAGDDQVFGGSGDDLVEAGDGNDTVAGEEGADQLSGAAGNDSLSGDDGIDVIFGGDGNDSISGGEGEDRIFAELGDDTISGDNGNDNINSGAGFDLVFGGEGTDRIFGGSENDQLFGDSDDDILDGSSGFDFLNGGDGDDFLVGATDNDNLFGGAGSDTLIGGFGSFENDTLTGGSDSDTFVLGNETTVFYDDGDPSTIGDSDFALITDFNSNQDFIELQGSEELYRLDFFTSSVGTVNAAIIFDPGVEALGEVIAILEGVSTDLTVDDPAFVFV